MILAKNINGHDSRSGEGCPSLQVRDDPVLVRVRGGGNGFAQARPVRVTMGKFPEETGESQIGHGRVPGLKGTHDPVSAAPVGPIVSRPLG